MSGRIQGPAVPVMSAAQASQLLDSVVADRLRELIDLEALLDFEQELWQALADCGFPRDTVPTISAEMIARAFTRLGEDHIKMATDAAILDGASRASG